ncbi:MAG: hypothetical protein ACRDYA_12870 [Egibacteraceae bacterium]
MEKKLWRRQPSISPLTAAAGLRVRWTTRISAFGNTVHSNGRRKALRGVTSMTGSSASSAPDAGVHALGTTNGSISTTRVGGGGTSGIMSGNRHATAPSSMS